MNNLNSHKIVGLLGGAVAIVGAFVAIPYQPLALLALGLVFGYGVAVEHKVRAIVSAIALTMFSSAFETIPVAGPYLQTITASVASLAVGAALFIILRNVYEQIKPF